MGQEVVVATRVILRGEVITSDSVKLGWGIDCPGTIGENERQLEAVVGTRALTDITPGQHVRRDAHCRVISEGVGRCVTWRD